MAERKAKTEEKILITPIMPVHFRQAEHEMQQWIAYVNPAATDEHLTDSKYWANIARILKAPAKIYIFAEDGTWEKVATVVANDGLWLKIHINETYIYDTAQPQSIAPDMQVKWSGMSQKWCVVRDDGEVLSKGHPTREVASEWIRSRKVTMAS